MNRIQDPKTYAAGTLPLAPEFAELVQGSMEQQGLMRHPGASIVSIGIGEVRIRLPFRLELTQQTRPSGA